MSKAKRIIATILSLVGIGLLIVAISLYLSHIQENKRVHESIADFTEPTGIPATAFPSATSEPPESTPDVELLVNTPTPQPTETPVPAITNPYLDGYLANEDMVGWLVIPGTNINYPVMWTPEDENYYLYRDFDKRDNKNGSLILDTDSCLNPLTTNLIIHGHNMKSGEMFGNLTDYEKKDYYLEHPQIILYTKECQRNYEIIAVFRSQVYKKSDNVFKYYKFFQADTENEFHDFYENIKELSLYDTGVNATFGDRFITLSTCVYHVTNGRFVVVAKELPPGDSYLPIEQSLN